MEYAESILDLVGNTPLVRLTRVTRDLGPAGDQPLILAKLELLSPGGRREHRQQHDRGQCRVFSSAKLHILFPTKLSGVATTIEIA